MSVGGFSLFASYLEFGVGVEHDVFDGALDVLRPAGQPRHSVVMPNLFPAVTSRGRRDTRFSAKQEKTQAVSAVEHLTLIKPAE